MSSTLQFISQNTPPRPTTVATSPAESEQLTIGMNLEYFYDLTRVRFIEDLDNNEDFSLLFEKIRGPGSESKKTKAYLKLGVSPSNTISTEGVKSRHHKRKALPSSIAGLECFARLDSGSNRDIITEAFAKEYGISVHRG
jgi:hypothetical protein